MIINSKWRRPPFGIWFIAYNSLATRCTGWSKKTDTQFYFWDNFGNSAPILTILSLLQAEINGA